MRETLDRLSFKPPWTALGVLSALALSAVWPAQAADAFLFIIGGLVTITPLVLPGILIAAWIAASGAGDRVADIFTRTGIGGIALVAIVGAVVPVCGITVLPLMVGLLATGVPLAPVMTFWLASPITSPTLFAATLSTLGWEFAVGKLIVAVGLGVSGGIATAAVSRSVWAVAPLRPNALVGSLGQTCGMENASFQPRIWREPVRMQRFWRESVATARLILICLVPAFAAEFALNAVLAPDSLTSILGADSMLAIPAAAVVGAPAYIDGYAALPLVRALLEAGMSPGAAMSFMIAGGGMSIWGALAIFPVLKIRPFVLFLMIAFTGAVLSGYAFEAVMG